jgi:hypothetical protein
MISKRCHKDYPFQTKQIHKRRFFISAKGGESQRRRRHPPPLSTSTLHWAKEVVVNMWDMHGLVNHNVIDLASQGVIIGKRTTNGGISFSAKGGVILFDNNSLVKVKES